MEGGEPEWEVLPKIYRENLYVLRNSWKNFAWAVRRLADLAISANLQFGSRNVGHAEDVLGYEM